MTVTSVPTTSRGFVHPALFYSGAAEYLAGADVKRALLALEAAA